MTIQATTTYSPAGRAPRGHIFRTVAGAVITVIAFIGISPTASASDVASQGQHQLGALSEINHYQAQRVSSTFRGDGASPNVGNWH
jgi:hypothetical protein